ncbi:Retrovirus-related Pol polyprotein from transposon RE1 [Linum perenne]
MVRGGASSVPEVPLIGSDHPFHISSGDNPGVLLVSNILTGPTDYFSWARSMERALMTKNKICFIDATYSAWERANVLVLGWLNKAMAPEIAQSVLWLDSARDVWVDLKERFSRSNLVRINDLHDQISNFRQGSLSVTSYYTRFKMLWDEYAMFRPLPSCICNPKCSCNALIRVRGYFQSEQIIRFLRGLNPSFAVVRSQIIRTEPLPSINQVFSMVSQEEQELGVPASSGIDTGGQSQILAASSSQNVVGSDSGGIQAFAGASQQTNFRRGTKRPVCTFCGLFGHTIEKCYKKVGYPPGYQRRKVVAVNSVQALAPVQVSAPVVASSSAGDVSGGVTISQAQYQSLYSLFQGHGSASQALGPNPGFASCVTRGHDESFNPAVDIPYVPNSTPSSTPPAQSAIEGSGLATQGMVLSASSKSVHSNGVWIVDSGASDHVVCSVDFLIQYKPVNGLTVVLPNRNRVSVSHVGSARLSEKLIVHNVLVIPSFSFNLLSTSKLTSQEGCNAVFSSKSCILQTQASSQMIGTARLVNGLYLLEQHSDVHALVVDGSSSVFFDLWHYRLGHASVQCQNLAKCPVNKHFHCRVCPSAKQTRIQFPNSSSHANQCFDLVHMDIWGSYSVASVGGHRYFLTIVDDHSRYTWVHLIKSKSEVRGLIKDFVAMVKNQYNRVVKVFRTDNGLEFSIPEFYASHGIEHQTTCVYTSQQNGRVERKHRHILNVARALLFQASLPVLFWGYAVVHAVHLINRLPTPVLSGKAPFEVFFPK